MVVSQEDLKTILRGNSTLEEWRNVFIPCHLAKQIGIEFEPEHVPNPENPNGLDKLKKELAEDEIEPIVVPPGIWVTAKLLCEKLTEAITKGE